ncbi:hypothetical protein BDW69DRAFT_177550 [Aspergillus filifer]
MSARTSSSSTDNPEFRFVTGNSQSEARSHAMREHWKRRHQRNHEKKIHHNRISPRSLLPRSQSSSNDEVSPSTQVRNYSSSKQGQGRGQQTDPGIPAQLLRGVRCALSSSRPDPFQTCPVHLTSQHQKLLHHWIGTHAAMMFEDLDVTEFNPMKDVWFPLDLSNASSFNCIMAHSAAHLAHLYAGTPVCRGIHSSDALKYKTEAVSILRLWLCDPEKELCDDAFSAVVRLLTYERYWGTVEDWKVHRDGLQRMIEAKGGVEALHGNWRLELVVYLVSLMSRPSWLEPTNQLERISRPLPSPSILQQADHTIAPDIQKVRCLWLISFTQDMRTFMGSFYSQGLSSYPFTHAAVGLLRQTFSQSFQYYRTETPMSELEEEMLGCLFAISVLVQESISTPSTASWTGLNTLDELEISLAESQHMWTHSVYYLRTFLYDSLTLLFGEGAFKVNYVMDLVQVLGTLSLEARQGVEKCLLNLLYSLGSNNSNGLLIDDGWSPDSFLSSMHGH